MQRIADNRFVTVATRDYAAGETVKFFNKAYAVEADAKQGETLILLVSSAAAPPVAGGIDMGEAVGVSSVSPQYTKRETTTKKRSSKAKE